MRSVFSYIVGMCDYKYSNIQDVTDELKTTMLVSIKKVIQISVAGRKYDVATGNDISSENIYEFLDDAIDYITKLAKSKKEISIMSFDPYIQDIIDSARMEQPNVEDADISDPYTEWSDYKLGDALPEYFWGIFKPELQEKKLRICLNEGGNSDGISLLNEELDDTRKFVKFCSYYHEELIKFMPISFPVIDKRKKMIGGSITRDGIPKYFWGRIPNGMNNLGGWHICERIGNTTDIILLDEVSRRKSFTLNDIFEYAEIKEPQL